MRSLESIEHLLRGRKFDHILGAYDYDLTKVFIGSAVNIQKKLVVFSHNTASYRILCEDFDDEMLIHHNHYMTSFLDNLALVALAPQVASKHGFKLEKPVPELFSSLARKFVAEKMFELGNSRMARVLFLEKMLEYEEHLRRIFTLRQSDTDLEQSSNLFTALASDFLLHHELAHVVSEFTNFEPYITEALNYLTTLPAYANRRPYQQQLLRDEVSADIFGLTVVMKVYAELASEETIRGFIKFLIGAVIRMEVLYNIAAEAHKANVDPTYQLGNIDNKYQELHARMRIMENYLNGIEFLSETVIPLNCDSFLVPETSEYLNQLIGTDFAAPISERSRRLANTISLGFENQEGFRAVINATRTTRLLERRS